MPLRIQQPSDKRDGLIVWDIEAAPTARVRAGQLVVHPHQVVSRFGELGAVEVVGTGRDIPLLRAPQPADLELGCLAAFRANVGGPLRLGRLAVKVSLIHNP